jgi:subtilisin family serine protease
MLHILRALSIRSAFLTISLLYPSGGFCDEIRVARNQLIVEWNNSITANSSSGGSGTYEIDAQSIEPISPLSNAVLVEIDDYDRIGPVRTSAEPIISTRELSVCHNLVTSGLARSCSPNYYVRALIVPNDSLPAEDYWHTAINSYGAWDVRTSSEDVVVGVIDSGINYNHPDLVDNMWRNPGEIPANGLDDDGNGVVDDVFGLNAINDSGNPLDDNVHGSHCAGIIGARGNNGQGVVGVGWQAKLMALKFLTAEGWGWFSDAIQAIDYAVMMKQRGVPIRVLNNSWGGGGYSQPLEAAIQRAHAEGIIFAAAAGNSATDNDVIPSYPASYEVPNIVSVASTFQGNELSRFSCFGENTVHIAAPGSWIRSTGLGSNYLSLSGTSMATPFVSGALALLLAHEPGLTSSQAIQRLYQSAVPNPHLEGAVSSGRILNVNNLIRGITVPNPTPGQVCSYGLTEIPYSDPLGRDAAPVVIPRSNGWPDSYRANLPFIFPFYQNNYTTMNVDVNGIVYFNNSFWQWDLSPLAYAPINSIAVLHTYLFNYPMPAQPLGVRVHTSPERVDVRWELPSQLNRSAGVPVATLSIFPSGAIEIHVDVPNDRVASTLLLGSLLGMRGENLANSITISRNGIPHLLRGRRGFLLSRPTTCSAGSQIATPAPTVSPTASPVPSAQPTAPHTPTPRREDEPRSAPTAAPTPRSDEQGPKLLSLSLKSRRAGSVRMGELMTLSVATSEAMNIPLQIQINDVACQQAASISAAQGVTNYRVRMPLLPYRATALQIGYEGVATTARVLGRNRVRSPQFDRACSLIVRALQH